MYYWRYLLSRGFARFWTCSSVVDSNFARSCYRLPLDCCYWTGQLCCSCQFFVSSLIVLYYWWKKIDSISQGRMSRTKRSCSLQCESYSDVCAGNYGCFANCDERLNAVIGHLRCFSSHQFPDLWFWCCSSPWALWIPFRGRKSCVAFVQAFWFSFRVILRELEVQCLFYLSWFWLPWAMMHTFAFST